MENSSQKTSELPQILAGFSVLAFILLGATSIFQEDFRYVATGLMLFSLFYTGYFALFFWKNRRKMVLDKITCLIFFLFFLSATLLIFFYGVSLFLHHYDIDWLYQLYVKGFKMIRN